MKKKPKTNNTTGKIYADPSAGTALGLAELCRITAEHSQQSSDGTDVIQFKQTCEAWNLLTPLTSSIKEQRVTFN